jgi:thioredoxin reductase (NADPH)
MLAERRALLLARARGPLRVIRVEHARLRSLLQTDPDLSEVVMRAFILRRVGLLSAGHGDVVVIGSRDSAATLRLQSFLVRNGHPYRYVDVDVDPDVQTLLDELHVDAKDIPILLCAGDRALRNPTDAEVADCLGFNEAFEPGVIHDVVICGAGPGGLAAAVYGASEGLDVLVVEASAPGGQAASSSKIENYLGFPTGVSGQALTARALTQAEKFGAKLAVARGAIRLSRRRRRALRGASSRATLPRRVLRRLDAAAEAVGESRSGFIATMTLVRTEPRWAGPAAAFSARGPSFGTVHFRWSLGGSNGWPGTGKNCP